MSKLSKLWLSARACADRAKPSIKIGAALGLAVTAGTICAPPQAQAASNLRVQTDKGPIKGFLVNGVAEFLGVPYATPPEGALRWKAPKAHAPWTAVLKTQAYAPICAQITTLGVFAGPANNNEDCLYLNVFTPNVSSSAKLPVIVWIHGGGNLDGETPGYDGAKMAANGKTVVVTIAYRLNLMGWLAHPALDTTPPFGNYGILDQQFALKWVKRNIAKFGGDKNNVTLGGQSAGAEDTGIALVSPLATGLFQRGICESACSSFTLRTLAVTEATGVAFSVAAGCGSGTDPATAKCLRNLTAAQVETLAGTASAASQYVVGPMVDGTVIPQQPSAAFTNGQFNHVPLINGDVEDEENFGLAITEYFSGPPRVPPTAAQYLNFVNTTYGTNASKVLARYPLSGFATPQLAWDRVGTDPGNCRARNFDHLMAPQVPLYAYEFDEQTAPFYFPKMPGFIPLAYHTSDIQFLFPLWSGGPDGIVHQLNNKQTTLSNQLVTAWTNFAWTGNPNGQGNSPWPRFRNQAVKPAWLIENIPALSTLSDNQYSALRNCDFWNSL